MYSEARNTSALPAKTGAICQQRERDYSSASKSPVPIIARQAVTLCSSLSLLLSKAVTKARGRTYHISSHFLNGHLAIIFTVFASPTPFITNFRNALILLNVNLWAM